MDFKYFFINTLKIEEQGLDIGFDLYCTGHLIWLAAIVAAAIFMARYYRRQKEEKKAGIKKFFAVAILCSEILKDSILIIIGAPMKGYLPLHLCGLAIFVMLWDAFGKNRKISGQMLAYAFMPGAISALLFCNWTEYPFFNFMCIHSFAFHGWIVLYVVMLYAAGEIRADYKGLWKTTGILAVCAVPIYILNVLIEENYLFLNEASEGSPLVFLWDIFGTRFGAPGYVASYAVLMLVVFHMLYLLYSLINKIRDNNTKRKESTIESATEIKEA